MTVMDLNENLKFLLLKNVMKNPVIIAINKNRKFRLAFTSINFSA